MFEMVRDPTFQQSYKIHWTQDFESKVRDNNWPRAKEWYKSPGAKREYEAIDEYKAAEGCDPDQVMKVMQTSKSSKCDGTCCKEYETLGELDLAIDSWKSDCPCRSNKVECSKDCPCYGNGCKNRAIAEK